MSLILSMLAPRTYAQQTVEDKKSYFINFNSSIEESVHDLRGDSINIQYHDGIGKTSTITVMVYDWHHAEVSRLMLQKSFGMNHYTMPLASLSATQSEVTYTCETVDESGRKYKFHFRREMQRPIELSISIKADPIDLKCGDLDHNMVSFFGTALQGRAPYTLKWFVLNENQTEFLYQPLEQVLNSSDVSSNIMVDKSPDYYVVLYVADACGNEGKRMVHVVCHENEKQINTLILENLPDVSTLLTPSK